MKKKLEKFRKTKGLYVDEAGIYIANIPELLAPKGQKAKGSITG